MFNAKIIFLALCMLITGKLGCGGRRLVHNADLQPEVLHSFCDAAHMSLCSRRHSQHHYHQVPGKTLALDLCVNSPQQKSADGEHGGLTGSRRCAGYHSDGH